MELDLNLPQKGDFCEFKKKISHRMFQNFADIFVHK